MSSVDSVVAKANKTRITLGLSQTEFSNKLGVSLRTYQEWEQGRKIPTGAARVLLNIVADNPELLRYTMDYSISKLI